jgi:hypothetical protein
MSKLNDKLQEKFRQLNLRLNTVKHTSPSALDSDEFEKHWKAFVAVSNEYKEKYTDEEIQSVIDALDVLIEFLSDK